MKAKLRKLCALSVITMIITTACGSEAETAATESSIDDSINQAAVIASTETKYEVVSENISESIKLSEETEDLSGIQWQGEVSFPDWKDSVIDGLAQNSMYSFWGYHGQGKLHLTLSDNVESFSMYINGNCIDTTMAVGGRDYVLDMSEVAVNGENTVQISNILPYDSGASVTLRIPYPVIVSGTPEEEGISEAALEMISDLIETDIENGFTSAQLSIIRNGKLIYENAWGVTNSYLPDGSVNTSSSKVTTKTLYDIASVTKMFSVNYALQKLVTDGTIDLDAKVTDFFGDDFYQNTILVDTPNITNPGVSLETIKKWKSEITIRDLLRHQGGFPADGKYCAPYLYIENLPAGESYPVNPLFAGNGADEATKQATIEMIFKTPLIYEPGTKTTYSDIDDMVLGLIIEKVTGQDLDTWLKENIYYPMGLEHITYNPLENGFTKEDCAATELNGNTRDGLLDFDGYRTYTIQGEVHDEKAYYSMNGISGHAGLFSNATDLAKLASVMLCGGYGDNSFFSRNVIDAFIAPDSEDNATWGLGWWRQGDMQRCRFYGTWAASDTIGHQGWTGTLVVINPEEKLVIAFLTNKRNTRITDVYKDANVFDGNWYTASTLGFVAQILSVGMDYEGDVSRQLMDLSADMAIDSVKLVPESKLSDPTHPGVRNIKSKVELFEKMAAKCDDSERAELLRQSINEVTADILQ